MTPRRRWGQLRPVPVAGDTDGRADALRDYDRILYSSAWRRLTGVTQVVSPQDDYIYHDRAMHSLKVAQVGQRIAEALLRQTRNLDKIINPAVVGAAGMAHDLGHPPFGHAAEKELQKVLDGEVGRSGAEIHQPVPHLNDSFEGNAQTFRIVAAISFRKSTQDGAGLNLSFRTLGALLKYPWERQNRPPEMRNDKWSVYATERDTFEITRSRLERQGAWTAERSIEAEIMDWADDVTYAVHDVEDFFRAGLLPLSELALHDETWDDFLGFTEERVREALGAEYDDKTFKEVSNLIIRPRLPRGLYTGAKQQRYELHGWASRTITDLTPVKSRRGTGLAVTVDGVSIPIRLRHIAEVLKKIVGWSVIVRPNLASTQHGQRKVIRELYFDLFTMTHTAVHSTSLRDRNKLPSRLADYYHLLQKGQAETAGTTQTAISRAVVDFIASLTDTQATLLHQRINGNTVRGLSPQWLSL
jgi:dGTPase